VTVTTAVAITIVATNRRSAVLRGERRDGRSSIANALLWRHPFYRVLLIAHIACYVGAILGWALEESRLGRLLKLPAFFLVTNVGAALAVAKLLRGERQVQWQPRKGA